MQLLADEADIPGIFPDPLSEVVACLRTYTTYDAVAANLFPREARANKNVFFDAKTGRARSLDDIYNMFSKKFSDGAVSPPPSTAPFSPAPATVSAPLTPTEIAQALPSLPETNPADMIIWNDSPRASARTAGLQSIHRVSPENMLMLAQVQQAMTQVALGRPQYNS